VRLLVCASQCLTFRCIRIPELRPTQQRFTGGEVVAYKLN
jgi:hypothetical protein